MNFELFRTICNIIGVPLVSRDTAGNLTVTDGNGKTSGLGKGTPVPITGSRSLSDADDGLVLVNKTANAYTITVPAGLKDGFSCSVIQGSTGVVTIAAGASVTVSNPTSYVKTGGAGSKLDLTPLDTNKYALSGNGAIA